MGVDQRCLHIGEAQDPLTLTLSRQGRGKQVEPYKSRLLRYARNDGEKGGKGILKGQYARTKAGRVTNTRGRRPLRTPASSQSSGASCTLTCPRNSAHS